MRTWAQQAEGGCAPGDLVPALLEHVVAPRVSIFTMLSANLGQTFSLDNGLVLQSLLEHWLHRFHTPKRSASRTPDALCLLKRNRQVRAVWWEARVVRILTWSTDDLPLVQQLCQELLRSSLTEVEAAAPCETKNHVISSAKDICAACTRALYLQLVTDYKCADLHL